MRRIHLLSGWILTRQLRFTQRLSNTPVNARVSYVDGYDYSEYVFRQTVAQTNETYEKRNEYTMTRENVWTLVKASNQWSLFVYILYALYKTRFRYSLAL